MFLTRLTRNPSHPRDPATFPWTVKLARDLDELVFRAPVTFLVGENGSGKSTLLEGIAAGMDAVALGAHDVEHDPSLEAAREFSRGFRFGRIGHPEVRLFLRAEDVRGFTARIAAEMAAMEAEADALAREPGPRGGGMGAGLLRGARAALARAYGEDTDARSHGETFLHLLQYRLRPGGLYLFDEPETPLSPARVLGLMRIVAGAVASGCQFIIATHSPMLMAQPDADILLIEDDAIRPVTWDDVEHVRVTRAFLRDPAAVLARVLD